MPQSRTDSALVGKTRVLAAEGFLETARGLGLCELPRAPKHGRPQYEGRGGVEVVDLPAGEGRALVRSYRHGGLSGLVFGPWFAGWSRAEREFDVTLAAFDSGVPCARPLAAITRRTLLLFYRAAFVSLEIPGSLDLAALAKKLAEGSLDPVSASKAAGAAARAVAEMHDKGFLHADLNLKNIVVSMDEDAFRASVIDFDLSRRAGQGLSRGCRMRNLMRLERSARKFERRGVAVPPGLRLRFLREYAAASGMSKPSRAEIRRWSWVFRLHSIAWFFFR